MIQSAIDRFRLAAEHPRQSSLIRAAGILVGGSVAAHAITLVVLPVTTRLYTPEHFSALSVFSSIIDILAVGTCLRFDAAIVMPEDEGDGANLFAVAILATITTSLLIALIMLFVPSSVYDLLNEPALVPHLWMVPLGMFITGAYLALQGWYVRQKRFSRIAQSRVGQAGVAGAAQVGFGVAGVAPFGLIIGHVLNSGVGALTLLGGMLRRDRSLRAQVSWRRMGAMFRAYDRFPRYSLWAGLANGLSNSAPLIIIAATAAGPEAGYLALSLFVLQAPMALLGNAIGQVYLSEAPKAQREKRLGRYTADVLSGLAVAGAGPLFFASIASPALFGLIFGEPWARSGILVSWMAPWFFLQFLSSPICTALHVTGHNKVMMIFQFAGVVVRVGSVILASFVAAEFISEVWAISGWVFYAGYLCTILAVVRVPRGTLLSASRRALPSIALGIGVGIVATAAAWEFGL